MAWESRGKLITKIDFYRLLVYNIIELDGGKNDRNLYVDEQRD